MSANAGKLASLGNAFRAVGVNPSPMGGSNISPKPPHKFRIVPRAWNDGPTIARGVSPDVREHRGPPDLPESAY
eukprot:594581-Alexandrium_andersonii.AAC.1